MHTAAHLVRRLTEQERAAFIAWCLPKDLLVLAVGVICDQDQGLSRSEVFKTLRWPPAQHPHEPRRSCAACHDRGLRRHPNSSNKITIKKETSRRSASKGRKTLGIFRPLIHLGQKSLSHLSCQVACPARGSCGDRLQTPRSARQRGRTSPKIGFSKARRAQGAHLRRVTSPRKAQGTWGAPSPPWPRRRST